MPVKTSTGREFPDGAAVIVASPASRTKHRPGGAWDAHCSCCGVSCPIDLANHLWRERAAVAVVCVPCAVRTYPDMLVGTVNGVEITIRTAWERGYIKL